MIERNKRSSVFRHICSSYIDDRFEIVVEILKNFMKIFLKFFLNLRLITKFGYSLNNLFRYFRISSEHL